MASTAKMRIGQEVPGMRLHFIQKPNKDAEPLRDGTVGLETGVVGKTTSPEVRTQDLFQDRFIGVVRMGHPLSKGGITLVWRPIPGIAGFADAFERFHQNATLTALLAAQRKQAQRGEQVLPTACRASDESFQQDRLGCIDQIGVYSFLIVSKSRFSSCYSLR